MKQINSSGKKKKATARTTIKKGTGNITINKIPLDIYTPELAKMKIYEPISLAGKKITSKIDISTITNGGGFMGQAIAARTSIAKGIIEFFNDSNLKEIYKKYDKFLLTNDIRNKLPKKPMGRGARAKKQKSYR